MRTVNPERIVVNGLELALRSADSRDEAFCYELMKNNMQDFFNRNTSEGWSRKKFRLGFDVNRITIVEHDGMPIGFSDCQMTSEGVYWRNIQISEDYQFGVGRKIARVVEETALCRGIYVIFGKVFAENRRMLKLLRVQGYQIGGDADKEKSFNITKRLSSR